MRLHILCAASPFHTSPPRRVPAARPSEARERKVASVQRRKSLATLLASLLVGLTCASTGGAAEAAPFPQAIRHAIERGQGHFSPELRAAYLQFAEDSVLADLEKRKTVIAPECLADVRKNADARDAVFGAIHPPDARILENYARLFSQLGPEFVARHRHLVLSAAVARRTQGVGAPKDSAADEADENDTPTKPEAKAPPTPDASVVAVTEFLKETKLPPVDVWKNEEAKARLVEFVKSRPADAGVMRDVTDTKRLFVVLKEAMVQLGQRPAAREPNADIATFFRHLLAIQDGKVPPLVSGRNREVRWPLFPVADAPWPLLMPLSQTLPMGEARYIWDKAQGKTDGARYHTYGPYRSGEKRMPVELQPLPWHWNAWPALIVQGGVCGVMSTIGSGTYNSLGKPAMRAGQPGHSCLMTYGGEPGAWVADIQQSATGGPMETRPYWPFGEATAPRMHETRGGGWKAGSEYAFGLAMAMNVGLGEYADTRIASHIYHMLPDDLRRANGWTLLADAIRINSFNPEPWYLLAKDLPGAGPERIPDVMKMLAGRGLGGRIGDSPDDGRSATASLEKFLEREPPPSVQKVSAIYFGVVRGVVEESLLGRPMPADEAAARNIYEGLKAAHAAAGDWPPTAMPYRVRFEGCEAPAVSLERRIRQHLEGRRKNRYALARETDAFKQELNSFLAAAPAAGRTRAAEKLRALISAEEAARLGPADPFLTSLDAAVKSSTPPPPKNG